jgi:hypothetical protein
MMHDVLSLHYRYAAYKAEEGEAPSEGENNRAAPTSPRHEVGTKVFECVVEARPRHGPVRSVGQRRSGPPT